MTENRELYQNPVGHFDPYDFFNLLVNEESGIAESSPKLTAFSKLPEERRHIVLPNNAPQTEENITLEYFEEKYQQRIFPSYCVDGILTSSKFREIVGQFNNGNTEIDFENILNIPSDFVVCAKRPGFESRIEWVLLRYQNEWTPLDAVGRSFGYMHTNIKNVNGALLMPKPEVIVSRILRSEENLERVGAIGLYQDSILNRSSFKDDPIEFDFDKNPNLFMRCERQAIVPFPDMDAFLFTVQTYFIDLTKPEYSKKFLKALKVSVDKNSNVYFSKHLEDAEKRSRILKYLEECGDE